MEVMGKTNIVQKDIPSLEQVSQSDCEIPILGDLKNGIG